MSQNLGLVSILHLINIYNLTQHKRNSRTQIRYMREVPPKTNFKNNPLNFLKCPQLVTEMSLIFTCIPPYFR